jgi:hypothetical protein
VELRGKLVATITEWLASLGTSEYAQRFADNRINDASILRDLMDQDLKDIGVPFEHRRKILRAIADMGAVPAQIQSAPALEAKPWDDAERRQLTVMSCDLVARYDAVHDQCAGRCFGPWFWQPQDWYCSVPTLDGLSRGFDRRHDSDPLMLVLGFWGNGDD